MPLCFCANFQCDSNNQDGDMKIKEDEQIDWSSLLSANPLALAEDIVTKGLAAKEITKCAPLSDLASKIDAEYLEKDLLEPVKVQQVEVEAENQPNHSILEKADLMRGTLDTEALSGTKNGPAVSEKQDVESLMQARRKRIEAQILSKYYSPHDSWTDCGEADDLLKLNSLRISPDPPVRGQPLTIAFEGDLAQPIEGSEVVTIQVKYGIIKIVDMTTSLCDELAKVEDIPQCPFAPGPWAFNHTETLPADIPPGRYTLTIEAYSKKFRKGIFCISGTFRFDPSIFNWWD
jgi:ML domain